MKKRINSNYYSIEKIFYNCKERCLEYVTLPDDRLYSKGIYPTNITSDDLPEWFIKGRYYKKFGFLSSKGVKYLKYVPNYTHNHLYKDDILYISFSQPITFKRYSDTRAGYEGYDYLISGSDIISYIEGVRKFSSDIETDSIVDLLLNKIDWFVETYPDYADMMNCDKLSEDLKNRFNK